MYFPVLDPATGRLLRLGLVPMRIRHFRPNRVPWEDAAWLADLLTREGRALGTRATLQPDGTLALVWTD